MKKEYEKPVVVFESFSMSTNIAAGCDRIVNTLSRGTCALPMGTGGISVFVDNVAACLYQASDGMYDNLCYHVPTEAYNLFNS